MGRAKRLGTGTPDAGLAIEYVRSPDEEKANLLIRFGPEGDGGLILSDLVS